MEVDALKDSASSASKRKVGFEAFAGEPVNAFQLNAGRGGSSSPTLGRGRIRKEFRVPEHKHELVVLTPIVKKRLHRIIRRLQNKPYRLHLKRQYKRQARERKVERRAEIVRKQKAAEKAAAKGAKGNKDGDRASTPTSPTKGKSPDKSTGKNAEKKYKPQHRVQKWRENKYRKWKKIKLRARFTKHELREGQFDQKHPATRPFTQSNFGVAPQEKEVKMLREMRTSSRWMDVMDGQTQGQFRPVPRANPYQEPRKKLSDAVAKRRLRHALKKEWEVSNHDRLQRDQMVKAMSRLIIQAKEQYDNEVRKSRSAPLIGDSVVTESVTGKGESSSLEDVQAKVNRDLQKKLRRLLEKRPSEQLDVVKSKLLPRIFRDKDVRRNTYINRPKTEYDLYMKHKLTDQTIRKYLQQRHLLSTVPTKRRKDGRGDVRRMPLPYRRFIVNHIQPDAVFLPSGKLIPSHLRMGTPLPEPLQRILPGDGSRVRTKIARKKRKPYGHHHDPHKPDRDAEAKKKKKPKKGDGKKDGEKAAPKAKGQSGGSKKGKGGTQKKGAPPKTDVKAWNKWHRKQKIQRRKRKLRKWIQGIEKRRRVKIAQEIVNEQNFRSKRDLPGMRKKVRQLEEQVDRANKLVHFLRTRNEYMTESYKEVFSRKHNEYFGTLFEYREECDHWFKLRDTLDQVRDDMQAQAKAFVERCREIVAETAELDYICTKENTNLETDYTQIINFIKHEPIWQEEMEHLACAPLYFDYLFAFFEAREDERINLASSLLQRKMHKDFMQMAYQERRKMRRMLPNACKRMLDERGLLAQEENKVHIWCNRMQKRQEKLTNPDLIKCEKELQELRLQAHEQVIQRQPLIDQSSAIKASLKDYSRQRKFLPSKKLPAGVKSSEKTDEVLKKRYEDEYRKNVRHRGVLDALKNSVHSLQNLIGNDHQQRQETYGVVKKAAEGLKRALGLDGDFGGTRAGFSPKDSSDLDTQLRGVMDLIQSETNATIGGNRKNSDDLARAGIMPLSYLDSTPSVELQSRSSTRAVASKIK